MEKLFVPGDILLPKNADPVLWSVIACDQYTSQPEYWADVDRRVGDNPSTLRMILPEAYLATHDADAERDKINATMHRYLEEGIFRTVENSFIYCERELTIGQTRHGLLGLIDLEAYDYRADSSSPVRATEKTVESRLPPRVQIRLQAALELPHIVVFIDDPENTVLGNVGQGETLYDFELMDGGGHIRGMRVTGADAERIEAALAALADPDYLEKRYQLNGRPPVVIAMGDGNHSLATARLCWERIRDKLTPEQRENHPARFALAELVNIHDASVTFEPIHRVVFDTQADAFFDEAKEYFSRSGGSEETSHELRFTCAGRTETITVNGLTIGRLIDTAQHFCERYVAVHGGRLDYIHGDDTVFEMTAKPGCAGVLLPVFDKSELFPSVIRSGVFPAKSFSIGPSRDKRYYLECRKIQ
ncbi:MAG: DUF1015 domain-containing protein [Oscillospiraceae bacterium]|jgi:hypothetical protein